MIDTIRIKIIGHLFEAILPPGKILLRHGVPIIGRKAPVLSVNREIVGGGARLRIHIKQIRSRPCIDTATIDPDRNIPFQNNPFLMGIFFRLIQLLMQKELQETIIIGDLFRSRICFQQMLQLIVAKNRKLAPLAELGRTQAIAQIAITSIREQPRFILTIESPVFIRSQHLVPVLSKQILTVIRFESQYLFIIQLRQFIELLCAVYIGILFLLIVQRQRSVSQIHRV